MKKILPILLVLIAPYSAFSMHIAEGFLPVQWSIGWGLAFVPFLVWGFQRLKKTIGRELQLKLLYAVVGAFVFVLSSLKLPSVTGSSSHMTGIALGALLFGAWSMSVIGFIVLLFQALLLAHGGLTTLGANSFSMAVVGAFVAVGVFRMLRSVNVSAVVAVFLAAFLSDMAIYICTSVQLSLAFQSEDGFVPNLLKFLSVFSVTQIPLAIVEGVLSVLFLKYVLRYNKEQILKMQPLLASLLK